jgi:hypothetical protein
MREGPDMYTSAVLRLNMHYTGDIAMISFQESNVESWYLNAMRFVWVHPSVIRHPRSGALAV